MTTVVADLRKGVMVSDSHESNGPSIHKIYRYDGALIGFSGNVSNALRAIGWIMRGSKGKPDEFQTDEDGDPEGFDLLVMKPETPLILISADLVALPVQDEFWAIGSGYEYAVGAMAAGKSAEDAVRIAARYDGYTKEPFHIERLVI